MRIAAKCTAAFVLTFAVLPTPAVPQSLPSPSNDATPGKHTLLPRKIHGIFDPGTGKFTPDTFKPAKAGNLSGNIDLTIKLQLDPDLAKHPESVGCFVDVGFFWTNPKELGVEIGNDSVPVLPLTPAGNTATESVPISYSVTKDPAATDYLADITVACFALGSPQSFHEVISVGLNGGGSIPVTVNGSI